MRMEGVLLQRHVEALENGTSWELLGRASFGEGRGAELRRGRAEEEEEEETQVDPRRWST